MSSRVSSKSTLSPSSGQGSNAIDLGKDSGVDMGEKSQVSASSGGIGVTQEVANIGGVSVSGGVSVDISPIGIDVSGDPSSNTISISGSAEVPGGLLGISGGTTIDTSTGEIIGGSIGGEVGGFGINVSSNKGDLGIEFTYQIPFTPIEISLGFGSLPTPVLTPTPTPTPTPLPSASIPPMSPGTKWPAPSVNIDSVRGCTLRVTWREEHIVLNPYSGTCEIFMSSASYYSYTSFAPDSVILKDKKCISEIRNVEGLWAMQTTIGTVVFECHKDWVISTWQDQSYLEQVLGYIYYYHIPSSYVAYDWTLADFGGGMPIVRQRKVSEPEITVFDCIANKNPIIYPPPTASAEPLDPPPNPPPRKQMDQCCRESMQMLRALMKVLEVRSVLQGKMQIPGELIAFPEEGKTLLPEKLQTYPQMVNAILLSVNRHGMDAPITVEIEDTDKTAAGSQEAIYTYNSPGVAMQAALEMLHELKAAGNARLSIQIGIAFAVTRTLKIVAGISESIREIIKMLGMPFRYKPIKMLFEFNLAGVKKGFGEDSKSKDFSEMSKEELESIIPTLLEGSECDIPVPKFSASESDDIRQMLAKLTIRKEK